jgi:hypothetical protein
MAAHNALGAWGEALVAQTLREAGSVQFGGPADLVFEGVAVEVKTARATAPAGDREHRSPRYRFLLRKVGHADLRGQVLVLVLAPAGECFVIPAAAVGARHLISIGVRAGQWEPYRERWETLAEVQA